MLVVMDGGEKNFPVVEDGDQMFDYYSNSSSSSSMIGKDSEDEGEENEVESPYKGPLDTMETLQEALPIRRGLSEFYTGKSKSFRNLADAVSVSVKDLGKPESPQSHRKRSFFSYGICSRGGISKKPIKSAFTTMIVREEQGHSSSSSSGEYSPPKKHQMITPPLPPRCYKTAASGNIHNIIC